MTTRNLMLAATVACIFTSNLAMAYEPPGRVECIAPAGPGGGLDFVCRSISKSLNDLGLVKPSIRVTNMPGGGHGVGYAHVISKRNGDDGVFVSGSTGTTTRLAQGAYPGGVSVDSVNWAVTMGAESGVIAVHKDSRFKDLGDLVEAMKGDVSSVTFAGASPAGGDDNLRVLLTAKKAGIKNLKAVRYLSFNNGGDAMVQVVGQHADVFTGDVSEAMGFFESGDIRILAILADKRVEGMLASVPTAKEQGVDAVWVNFRGLYLAPGISDEAYNWWVDTFHKLYQTPEWKTIMRQNGLVDFHYTGEEMKKFVSQQVADVRDISEELGIVKK